LNPQPKPQTKRLKGKAYTKFRESVHRRAHGVCEICGCYAPLKDADGNFDVYGCGHVCHFKSRGAGGEDTLENAYWACYECHMRKDHGPRWSKVVLQLT
jgi:5-methylcytosine-specific restriction endonuclease McrA